MNNERRLSSISRDFMREKTATKGAYGQREANWIRVKRSRGRRGYDMK